jgi:hypothetical protein
MEMDMVPIHDMQEQINQWVADDYIKIPAHINWIWISILTIAIIAIIFWYCSPTCIHHMRNKGRELAIKYWGITSPIQPSSNDVEMSVSKPQFRSTTNTEELDTCHYLQPKSADKAHYMVPLARDEVEHDHDSSHSSEGTTNSKKNVSIILNHQYESPQCELTYANV